ncbi:FlgD immunoglobulin-like domain containing protein [Nocardioides sp. LHD-245]|uniref:FlgD immunoglobulin-like domain containing protein n=1 Tax=Nocardioides sp. LHD-245 TaxID=3051387 RepID=UPI0027E13A36|nr:FlgD immunoglobulin-like domain containing protein [Nocardioides sp. LHD-245]
MGRWTRSATAVAALATALATAGTTLPAGATLPAAEAADAPVQLRFTTQPKVTFTGLSGADGEAWAAVGVGWSPSRPANVTVRVADGTGSVVRTFLDGVSVRDAPQQVTWDYTDASGTAVPEGDYTMRFEAVDSEGNRDVETYAVPLDRHTRVPLEGVVSGATYSGDVTMTISPRPGLTLIGGRFTIGQGYHAPDCLWTPERTPGTGGSIRSTFSVDDCGAYDGSAGAMFTFTDRLGARQTGYALRVPVRIADRVAPTATIYPYSPSSQTLHLRSPGAYETSDFTYAVRDAGVLESRTYEVRTTLGQLVASGALPVGQGLASDELTRLIPFRWDGTRNDGSPLPAGTYRVRTRFTDESGNSGTGPVVPIVLDATIPGTLALTPLDTNRWQAVVTPKAGAGVTAAALSAYGPSPLPMSYDAATGTYRAVLDLNGQPARTYPVGALVTRGTTPPTTFATATQDLVAVVPPDTAPPVVTPPADTRIYLRDAGAYHLAGFRFDVRDQSSFRSSAFVVSDAAGTVVDHRIGVGGAYVESFSWDGTGPDGAPLPAGDYVVRTTFTDAQGHATPAAVTVRLDRTVPGSLAITRVEGNRFLAELTPAAGAALDGVRLHWVGSTKVTPLPRDAARGTFRAVLDLEAQPLGSYRFEALVDRPVPQAAGGTAAQGTFTTEQVELTVADVTAPVVTGPPAATQYLRAPDAYDPVVLSYPATESSPFTGVAWVVDATGRTVRGERPMQDPLLPGRVVRTATWDGRDDQGALQPAGTYLVRTRFTDAAGNTTTGPPVALTLDDAVPGELLTPAPGDTLAGTAPVEFRATTRPGMSVYRVGVQLVDAPDGGAVTLHNASPDGVWRTTWPMGGMPAGPRRLATWISWLDDRGTSHTYAAEDRTVVIDPTGIPVRAEPRTDPGSLTAGLAVATSSPHGDDVTVAVDWGDGSAPTRAVVPAPYAVPTYTHTYPRAGTYDATLTASAGLETTTLTTRVIVTASGAATVVPGTGAGSTPAPPGTGPGALPPRVGKVRAAVRAGAVRLRWRAGAAADGTAPPTTYVIQRRGRGDDGWTVVRSVRADRTATTLRGLRPGSVVRLRVVALNPAGMAEPSRAVTVRPRR